ncbi:MAG: helix-turn-helix domain-containing protein, partial [Candidatus Scalindua sp.]|nr:helix-turn-helix domain-containing protein [Candidatus Scalindua sp.]
MNFTELVEIMSSNGVMNLADIARKLEVSPQSVSNWKARDQVPYKYVVEVQNRYQPSHDGNSQAEPSSSTTETQESSAPRMRSAPLPPFLVEEEKTFSLAEFIMPVAQNLRFTIRSTVVMTMVGVLIFLFSTILAFFSKQEPEQ